MLQIGSMISSEEEVGSGQSLETHANVVPNLAGAGQMYSTCGNGKQNSLSRQAGICL